MSNKFIYRYMVKLFVAFIDVVNMGTFVKVDRKNRLVVV